MVSVNNLSLNLRFCLMWALSLRSKLCGKCVIIWREITMLAVFAGIWVWGWKNFMIMKKLKVALLIVRVNFFSISLTSKGLNNSSIISRIWSTSHLKQVEALNLFMCCLVHFQAIEWLRFIILMTTETENQKSWSNIFGQSKPEKRVWSTDRIRTQPSKYSPKFSSLT